MIYGEFNGFSPADAETVLQKAWHALGKAGTLLLEAHTYAAVQSEGTAPPAWYSSPGGLFSDCPHLCLSESFWDAERGIATERYYILDVESGLVTRHAASMQAYTDDDYRRLLGAAGFKDTAFHPDLGGGEAADERFIVITARK